MKNSFPTLSEPQALRHAAADFLHYGYDPTPKASPMIFDNRKQWDWEDKTLQRNSYAQASQTGAEIMLNILKHELEQSGPSLQVLPLSGGLDSRLLLGGLLHFLSPTEIQAITYGLPGTWDAELARRVAKKAGIRHEFIDLSTIDWNISILEDVIRHGGNIISVFEAMPHQLIHGYFSQPLKIWSGFLGGTSGRNFQRKIQVSKADAIFRVATQQLACRNVLLTPDGYDPAFPLKKFDFFEDSLLDYDFQLRFGIRNNNYLYHIVIDSRPDYITPYTHPDWLHFFFNQPIDYVLEQRLVKQIGLILTPELYSLPFKNNFGLPLNAGRLRRLPVMAKLALQKWFPAPIWGIRPFLNYFDYDESLRIKQDIKEIVGQSIMDLARREIIDWLDIQKLWQDHQQNPNARYGRALTLLASLELNLKVFLDA